MTNSKLFLETALGKLVFSVDIEQGDPNLNLYLCSLKIELPQGMSVENHDACILNCTAVRRMKNLIFQCYWENPFAKGSPETGECLDAQLWENRTSRVLIGTENFDALSRRLPNCGISRDNWHPFPEYGLLIKIPIIEPDQEISLHFLVASNTLPEPQDCSCWFAVDIDHSKVLQCIK